MSFNYRNVIIMIAKGYLKFKNNINYNYFENLDSYLWFWTLRVIRNQERLGCILICFKLIQQVYLIKNRNTKNQNSTHWECVVLFQPALIAAVKEFGQIFNIRFANIYIYILEMRRYIHPLWKPGLIENCCDLFIWKILMDRKQFLSVS